MQEKEVRSEGRRGELDPGDGRGDRGSDPGVPSGTRVGECPAGASQAEAPMRELAAYRAAQPRGWSRVLRVLRCSPIFGWGATPRELGPRRVRSVRRRASEVRGA